MDLREALSQLTYRQRHITLMRYGLDESSLGRIWTLAEIAAAFRIGEETVERLLARARTRLEKREAWHALEAASRLATGAPQF